VTTLPKLLVQVRARRELPPPSVRRAVRQAAQASLDEVGAAVGVTGQAVWWWESGQRQPNAANVGRYLEVLRVLGEAATLADSEKQENE